MKVLRYSGEAFMRVAGNVLLLMLLISAGSSCATRSSVEQRDNSSRRAKAGWHVANVSPLPDEVRREFSLDLFYQKYISLSGLPIVASTNVSDYAVREVAWVLGHMMEGRDDILHVLASNHVRLAVMAWNEYTTDLPEERHLTPRVFWDHRVRGLTDGLLVSCAEENLLDYPGDGFRKECIIIHEFAHVLEQKGLRVMDHTFNSRLKAAYNGAISNGLWKSTYAGKNPDEYWAEGVKNWFDHDRTNDAQNNHVNTREKLKEYDHELAKLCTEIFGDRKWRYRKPRKRVSDDLIHLAGYNASKAPHFKWRTEPMPEKPLVRILTTLGDIEVELYRSQAPATVTNFINYVDKGLYTEGTFFRTVTASNQPNDKVRIEIVQIEANQAKRKDFLPPIPLERTRDTGLRHLDGSLSMARGKPDSAQDSFFICIGDQPELDFGGRRNPDGQGFAVFGKVVKGMDVVRKIQQLPADGQKLKPPLRIPQVVRLN